MVDEINNKEMTRLKEMTKRIEEIDRLVLELKNIGKGLPVIEKNVLNILSFTHALRFGISDIAEVSDI